jgi:predicted transcriptional regulator of viral defense system
MEQLRQVIPYEEFDYLTLLGALKTFARPRDKITALLRAGAIVRVKKGLYVFGPSYCREAYSQELLANWIYGPSYLSLEYALARYGMIPERVETLTSVTCGKSRTFNTPVGRFTYRSVAMRAYWIGVDRVELAGNRSFLMATREKALADMLCQDRGAAIRSLKRLEAFLAEDLRVDPDALRGLDPVAMGAIAEQYRSRRIALLASYLEKRGTRGSDE